MTDRIAQARAQVNHQGYSGREAARQPYIPLLREDNRRTGFFEPDQLRSVLAHLPDEIQPIVTFAYITGWRIASEVLPIQWRHVDFRTGENRLNAGTTKNNEGRVFVMTDDLRALLEARHADHERQKKGGHISLATVISVSLQHA